MPTVEFLEDSPSASKKRTSEVQISQDMENLSLLGASEPPDDKKAKRQENKENVFGTPKPSSAKQYRHAKTTPASAKSKTAIEGSKEGSPSPYKGSKFTFTSPKPTFPEVHPGGDWRQSPRANNEAVFGMFASQGMFGNQGLFGSQGLFGNSGLFQSPNPQPTHQVKSLSAGSPSFGQINTTFSASKDEVSDKKPEKLASITNRSKNSSSTRVERSNKVYVFHFHGSESSQSKFGVDSHSNKKPFGSKTNKYEFNFADGDPVPVESNDKNVYEFHFYGDEENNEYVFNFD